MTKILTKTGIQKFLTAIIIVFSLFAILPTSTAMAEEEPAAQNQENNQEQAQDENEGGAADPAADSDLMNIDLQSILGEEGLKEVRSQMSILLLIQGALNHLLWPILVLIGGLLDNSLLFGSGMDETLRSIWIPMRNLANILFILILVGIALYNVLGIGDENNEYAIKTILPKIIIGIIAVNFSFFGMKVILDGVNMLTVSIFSLPNQVSGGMSEVVGENDTETIQAFCARELMWDTKTYREAEPEKRRQRQENISRDYGAGAIGRLIPGDTTPPAPATNEEEGRIKFFCKLEGELTSHGQRFLSSWNYNNAALAMALSMGEIQFFEIPTPDSLLDIKNLTLNTLLSMVFYLVYAVSFIALFVVLLVRIVALWLFVAMSPLLILVMSTGIKEKLGSGISQMVDSVAKYILAPIMVAIPMTIGWIMLNAIKASTSFMVSETGGELGGFMTGIPVTGMNSLQQLMVGIGTIAVVWVGVFAAADGTVAKVATDKIQGWAKMAGTYVGTMPFRHLPIVPIGGDKASLSALKRGLEARMAGGGMLSDKQEDLRRKISGQQGMSIGDFERKVRDKNSLLRWVKDNERNPQEVAKKIEELRKTDKTRYIALQNGMSQELVRKMDDLKANNSQSIQNFMGHPDIKGLPSTKSQAGALTMRERNIGQREKGLTGAERETLDTKINDVTNATTVEDATTAITALVQLNFTEITELQHFKDVLGENKYNALIRKPGITPEIITTAINGVPPPAPPPPAPTAGGAGGAGGTGGTSASTGTAGGAPAPPAP